MFGTWYGGTKKPTEYGIGDPGYDHQPFRQFVHDTLVFYKSLGFVLSYPVRKVMSLWEVRAENPGAPAPRFAAGDVAEEETAPVRGSTMAPRPGDSGLLPIQ